MTLLEALETIHRQMQFSNAWHEEGLCQTLYDVSEQDDSLRLEFLKLVRKWPKYTGRVTYPVPAPECYSNKDPKDSFILYTADLRAEAERLWDRANSPYAELRWQLLEFCITELGGSYANPE